MKLFFSLLLFAVTCFAKSEFSIMSYNVENLFDTQHDAGKDDETYLPLTMKASKAFKAKCRLLSNFKFRKDCYQLNWDEKTLSRKMKNLSEVILSVDNGRGPDILILAEVENKSVLEKFNGEYLSAGKYKTIELIEAGDARGIDVAILSRFPKIEKARSLSLKLDGQPHTRGVLRVPLRISNSKTLSVFAAHLPSQGSPTSVRIQAVELLNNILKSEKIPWIVGGDFNITQKEEENGQLVSEKLAQHGVISHLVGCRRCAGTHFYKNKWSFLDILYFSTLLKNQGLQVMTDSIRVINDVHVNAAKVSPQRFDPVRGKGASDHFPIYARIRLD